MDEIEEIKRRLDIVDIVSSYLTLKKAGTNLKANCPFHQEKTPSFMVSPERQTFKCFGCFPAGQLIETAEGFKEIQDIKKNDLVYTFQGHLKKVNLVFERRYKGDLLKIIPRMVSSPIKITGDHRVYAVRTINCKQKSRKSRICQRNCTQNCPTKFFSEYKLEKIEARQLKENDYLLYPLKEFPSPNKEVNLLEFTGVNFKRGLRPRIFPINIKIDSKFARLAGLYIAEGSNHRAYIRFSLGNHEEKLAQEIKDLISEIFGLDSSIHVRKGEKTGIEVTCCNSLLSRIFENSFGKGAAQKMIPQFFFGQERKILNELLSGIIDGDGTRTRATKKTRAGHIAVRVISHCLVHQIKDILLLLGIKPSINYYGEYVSNKGINHRDSWSISWYDDVKAEYSDIVEVNGTKYWLLPIRKIKKSIFEGKVYNLNVYEDHSYLTQSFAVANCGEGGDIFTFIEKIEGLDFYNALKVLADRAGVILKKRSVTHGDNECKADRKTTLFEINDLAMKAYHKILLDHPKAEEARKYLKKREMSEETIEEFKIGYAPDSWDFLIRFLAKHGHKEEEMFQAGLVVRGEKGKYYDRFRGRIMFPINNIMGQTIAFTSRVLIDDAKEAKYLNSADSPIYTKGDVLYGLDKARMAIKERDLAVVVEGNMDVIACHQAGYKNVVASSGTALTEQQLKILTRYGSEIAFCFDTDPAGETAMKRAVTLAVKNDLTAKIVAIPPPFKDPDEAIKNSPKIWEQAILNAKPSLEYWIDLLIRKNPELDITDKKKIAKEVLPIIKMTYSPIEKEAYIKYLAEKLSVSEKSLLDALSKSKSERSDRSRSSPNQRPAEKKNRELTIIERFLALIWHDPKLAEKIPEDLIREIESENSKTFLTMIKAKEIDKEKVSSEEAAQLEASLMTIASEIDLNDGETNLSEFTYLVARMQTDKRESLRQGFAKKIKEAERAGDHEAIRRLVAEFSSLIK